MKRLFAAGILAVMTMMLLGCGGSSGGAGTPPTQTTQTTVASFAGIYSGSYSGADSGTVTVTIATDGSISGSGKSTVDPSYQFTISGQVAAGGNVNLQGTGSAGTATFSGTVTSQGVLSGTWTSSEIGGGTFTTTTTTTTTPTTPTTSPTPTTGQIAIWSSSPTTMSGSTSVTIDNAYAGAITTYYTSPPTCGGNGTITKTLTSGTHSLSAVDGTLTWGPANFIITPGGCLTYDLSNDNATGGTSQEPCPSGFVRSGILNLCQSPTTPTCIPPQFLQNGECVTALPIPSPVYGSIGITTPATHKSNSTDICTSWQVIGAPVKLSTCSYASGSSGYIAIENNGSVADICWSTSYNNGRTPDNGCYSAMPSGEITSPSCYTCGLQSGGASMIELTEFNSK